MRFLVAAVVFAAASVARAAPIICQNSTSSTESRLVARSNASCPQGFVPAAGVAGANLFDVLWLSSSGMDTGTAGFDDAIEELRSASASGIRMFRFFASLWGTFLSHVLSYQASVVPCIFNPCATFCVVAHRSGDELLGSQPQSVLVRIRCPGG